MGAGEAWPRRWWAAPDTGEVNSGHPGPRPSGVPPSPARGFFAPARSWASPLLFGQFRPPVGAPHAESVPDDSDAVGLRAAHARPLHSPCSRPVGPPTDGIRMNDCGRGVASDMAGGAGRRRIRARHGLAPTSIPQTGKSSRLQNVEIDNDCLGKGMRLAGEDIAGLHLLC